LRDQARDLIRGQKEGDRAVLQRIREFHPSFDRLSDEQITAAKFRLADAFHAIAREYMFESWPKLKQAIESATVPNEETPLEDRITDPLFRQAVRCIDTGDVEGLKRVLIQRPNLVRQRVYFNASNYFGHPGLLQFVAQNPIRQTTMPNVLEIAKTIIDAGVSRADLTETLSLVATGRIPRENHVQIKLIDLLCERGAEVRSLIGVLAHGEFEAAGAMLRHGGQVTLPVAAAFGWLSEFEALLPSASAGDRHLALAFSAQFGRVQVLMRLLDAGEDPNRYNPPGAHAHSTPLHQAVIHEQGEAVKVLLEAGARADIPDTLFRGTALGWAEHENLPQMAAILRERGSR